MNHQCVIIVVTVATFSQQIAASIHAPTVTSIDPMNKPVLSVIIPTHNREAILQRHLQLLRESILRPDLYEVIIVSDGVTFSDVCKKKFAADQFDFSISLHEKEKSGPAATRNFGFSKTRGEYILFVGDDTFPTPNLLWRHYYQYTRGPRYIAVQGKTEWHPDIPPDDFMIFLTGDGGLQANWNALKDENGKWRNRAPGWFMTTNCSIHRDLFERIGGFYEGFPDPAWEDIEIGYRIAKQGIQTIFDPDAVNLHYHRITLQSFIQRQIMEGKSRLILCGQHPETAGSFLDPKGLREYNDSNFRHLIRLAEETHFSDAPDTQKTRKDRWMAVLRMASLKGILEGIEARGGGWQALPHVHTDELARYVVGASSYIEKKNPEFAQMEAEWGIKTHKDNWALWALDGEVKIALEDKIGARQSFIRALELAPDSKWAKSKLDELM